MPNIYGVNRDSIRSIVSVVNNLVASANETRTDHLGTGTSYQVWATEIAADHASLITWMTEIDGDNNEINDYLSYLGERDGVEFGTHGFAGAAATTVLGSGMVVYRIGGQRFSAIVDTTVTLTDTTAVTGSNWKAWRIVIDRTGTVTTETVTGSAGFANEEDALLNLGRVSQAANTVEIGYWTVNASTGFTPQTDNTNGEAAENTYLVHGPRLGVGLNAALGSSVVADAAAATWSVGTIDARLEAGPDTATGAGVSRNLAQISAITNQAMDDADTIADGEFGGWLLVTNLAGTGVYALASDGVAGSVSVLADGSDAGVQTALDTLANRLPLIFCPIGEIRVTNASGGGFTAGTTNWDAAGVTTTVADQPFATFDRTVTTGRAARNIDAPAVPADITAALLATLTAGVPAAHSSAAAATITDEQGTP